MPNDEGEIRELVRTWMEATRAGDKGKVLELMSEDAVFLIPGRPPMIGKSAFAATMENRAAGRGPRVEGTSEIQELKILGDWAFMWTKLKVVMTAPDGTPPSVRAGHTLTILRKEEGRWVLARDANLLAPV